MYLVEERAFSRVRFIESRFYKQVGILVLEPMYADRSMHRSVNVASILGKEPSVFLENTLGLKVPIAKRNQDLSYPTRLVKGCSLPAAHLLAYDLTPRNEEYRRNRGDIARYHTYAHVCAKGLEGLEGIKGVEGIERIEGMGR